MSKAYYYGHGKLLLTGEYAVLDGAKSLAVPTNLGQQMHVQYRPSSVPKLYWKSYDSQDNLWFSVVFELWHFNVLEYDETISNRQQVETLQQVLRQARKQNIHFLREQADLHVDTRVEFPLDWGLGTSSTLIYNIAQWAYVSPFELLDKSFGGSGYDIACAQSMGPIIYQKTKSGPKWETAEFSPHFKDSLFFIHQNQKQSSHSERERYENLPIMDRGELVQKISALTDQCLQARDLGEFEKAVREHEIILGQAIDRQPIQQQKFSDYPGVIKSLGAWGGDFMLATSLRGKAEVEDYFASKGHHTCLSFDEIILQNFPRFGDPDLFESESELSKVRLEKDYSNANIMGK